MKSGSARPSDQATGKARRAEKSTETRPEPACVLAARISGASSTITASNSARVSVSTTRPGMSLSEIQTLWLSKANHAVADP